MGSERIYFSHTKLNSLVPVSIPHSRFRTTKMEQFINDLLRVLSPSHAVGSEHGKVGDIVFFKR